MTVGNIYSIANWIPLVLLHLVTEHQPHQCGLQAGVSISKAEGNGSFLFPLVHTLCTLGVDWMCWTVKDFQFVYSGNDQHGAATQPGALIKPIPAQKMVIMVWLIWKKLPAMEVWELSQQKLRVDCQNGAKGLLCEHDFQAGVLDLKCSLWESWFLCLYYSAALTLSSKPLPQEYTVRCFIIPVLK